MRCRTTPLSSRTADLQAEARNHFSSESRTQLCRVLQAYIVHREFFSLDLETTAVRTTVYSLCQAPRHSLTVATT